MKQLRTIIAAYADTCSRLGAERAEARLCILLPALVAGRDMSIAEWRAKAELMDELEPGGAPLVADVCADLRLLDRLLRSTATARSRQKLLSLIETLDRQRMASLKAFVDALQAVCEGRPCRFVEPRRRAYETLTAAYARRLNETASDPLAFSNVFSAMDKDPAVKRAEIVDVANQFAGPTPKSITKDAALKHIREGRMRAALKADPFHRIDSAPSI